MRRTHLERYREIVRVLSRRGFGWLLVEFQRRNLLPLAHRHEAADPAAQAVELRLAFEELGTTFIKLVQMLSTRPDLLPPAYIAELTRLQDAVPPVPYAAIAATLEAELGRPVDEVFSWFDAEPLAAASIGQVHLARLPGGEEVVVKVRRPGIAAMADLLEPSAAAYFGLLFLIVAPVLAFLTILVVARPARREATGP